LEKTAGNLDANRIKYNRKSDDTNAGRTEMFFLFLCAETGQPGERIRYYGGKLTASTSYLDFIDHSSLNFIYFLQFLPLY